MRTPILQSTLLILFLNVFSDVHGQACPVPGCYEDIPRHFAFNPGDYQPTNMTTNICKQKCGLYRMPYAALAGGSFCFCGNTLPAASNIKPAVNCNAPCSGNPALTECGGLRHVNVHCVTPPPEDVKVNMADVVEVLQKNSINITTLKQSTGYAYKLDGSDGNGPETVASNVVEKAFSVAGEHTVTATVSDSSGIAASSSGSTMIYAQVPVEKLELKGPDVWVATAEITFNATVLSGTLMTVDLDYKDGQPHDNFPIADAYWFGAGTGVGTASAGAATANKVYVRYNTDFMETGTLVAFEYFAQGTGAVNFMVLRPSCSANTYCHETNSCPVTCTSSAQATCTAGQVFCGFRSMCTSNTLPSASCAAPAVRHTATPATNLQYTVVTVIPHTVAAAGYGSLKIDPATNLVEILPGDVVGYFSGAAVIGQSTEGPSDFTATGLTTAAAATVIATSTFANAGHRVLLRGIASRPSTVMFYHTFDQPGQYDIVLNVTNDLLPGKFVTTARTVYIEEGINSTVIFNNEYGVTNEPATFEVLPHTGSNLTYEWNFGEKPFLNVTQAGRFFNYTYLARGQYNVTVRVYNRLLSRNNDSSIIIEDRIKDVGLFAPNAATGQPYLVTFNMTSGSDYECDYSWGDGTTFKANWTTMASGAVQTHVYNSEGWYTITVTCRNNVSSGTASIRRVSIDPPVNITLIKTGAIKATKFKIQWKIDKGTNTTWTLYLENMTYPIQWDEATKTGATENFLDALPVGRYLLKLHVINPVADEWLVKNFTVDNPIIGLTYVPTTLQEVLVGYPVTFTTNMTGGSSVILTIQYQDGSADDILDTTNGGNDLIDWPGQKVFTHYFNRPGSFNVTATVKNNFNFSQFTTLVDAYNKVANLTLRSNSPIPFLNDKATVEFWYESPTDPPTKAFIEWQWGNTDPILQNDPFLPLRTKKLKDYMITGKFVVNTNVSNKISWGKFNTSIHILRPVVSLELDVVPPHVVVNTPVKFRVSMETGDDVTIHYITGVPGAVIVSNPRTKTSPYQWDEFQTTYTTQGVYQVMVIASNALGNTTKIYEIHVQDPVKPSFILKSNFPVEFIGGSATVTFNLTYPLTDTLPTNPSILLDYGDSGDIYPTPQTLTIGTRVWTFTHTYTTPGDYTTNFTIFNMASNQTFTVQSGVYERITSISCTALQQKLIPNGGPDVPGVGPNNLTFPLHNPLKLHFTVAKGTVSKYKVNANLVPPVTDYESTIQPVAVTLSQAGDYTITCQAWNPLNSASATVNVKMAEGIQGVTVTNRQLIKPGVETTFTVGVASIGTDSCMVVDFGEKNVVNSYYGTAVGCAGKLPSGVSLITGPILTSMQLKYTYKSMGIYEVTLTGYTDSLQTTNSSKLLVTVSKDNCLSPLIGLTPNNPLFYSPFTIERNEYVKLTAKNTINCQESLENTKLWKVFAVSETTGQVIKEIDISAVATRLTANLVLDQRFLDYGTYRFNFRMAMKVGKEEFPAEENTFVKVVPPPLIVSIAEGGMSVIKRGWNTTVTLSPRLNSFDPGVDPSGPQGLSFECFCRRTDEIFKTYKNGSLISTNASAFMTDAQLNADTAPDQGGCARRGPGVLTLDDHGNFTFNTRNMRVNESYEFQCRIWKDSREAVAKLVVNNVDGVPPQIIQACAGQNQALCRPIPGGQLINPNNRMALKSSCINECGNGQIQYLYSIERRRVNRAWVEINIAEHVQGTDSSQIALPTALFMSDYEKYQEYMDYRVKVQATVPGNPVTGESFIVLDMNIPPKPGTCTLDKSAYNLGEKATFTSSGWTDPDNVEDTTIKAFVAGQESELTFLDAGRTQVVLPLGDKNSGDIVSLKCFVKDRYGAVTAFDMANVTVIMDAATEKKTISTLQNIAENMDQSLKKATEEGDAPTIVAMVAKIMTQVQAVSDTKLTTLKSDLDAENAKLEAALKNNNLTESEKRALIKARDDAEAVYQALRDIIVQCKEKCIQALASLEVVTPEGMIAMARTVDGMDNPDQATLVVKKTMYNQGIALASGLAKNAKDMPREDMEIVAKAALKCLFTSLHSSQNIMEDPTLTDYIRIKSSENYFYDADLESPSEEMAPDDFKKFKKSAIKGDVQQQSKDTSKEAIKALQSVALAALGALVNGEAPINIKVCDGPAESQLIAKKQRFSSLSEPTTQQGVSYQLPKNMVPKKILPDNSVEDPVLGVASMTTKRNPLPTANRGARVNTATMDLTLTHENGDPWIFLDLDPPIDLFFDVDEEKSAEYLQTPKLPRLKEGSPIRFFYYHSVDCKECDGVRVRIKPSVNGTRYLVLADKEDFPNCTMDGNCSTIAWMVLPQEKSANVSDEYMALFSNIKMGKSKYKVIFGVRELHGDELAAYENDPSKIPKLTTPQHEVFTKTYVSEFTCVGAFYYETTLGWNDNGLKIGHLTSPRKIHIQTNHTSLFGAGFAVQPNKIDWAFVFSNMDFFKNPTLYIVEIITCIIFVLALIWARYKDKKDKLKLGVCPLPDNEADDKYLYEILVYTGMRTNAGTESKVNFIISGEYDETDVRTFEDPERKIFKRGAVDSFLMAAPHRLGALNYIRVWHDNKGKGKYGSWYLKYVIVTDLQTLEKYFFLCNQWLAAEEGDGSVDRLLAVAGKEQMTDFSHLFSHSTKKKLDDDHLWFSVVARPPQSRFTRVQRVCCCLLLLYTTMLADAVFYETAASNSGKKVFSVGPFALTPQQFYVGIISNLIVFPINFVVVFLFRKSRPRRKRPSRIAEALRRMQEQKKKRGSDADLKEQNQFDDPNEGKDPEGYPIATISRPMSSHSCRSRLIPIDPEQPMDHQEPAPKEEVKKKFSFPWWCVIIAWFLLIISVMISVAFVTFYGVMFGDEKAKKWLTSMLVAFFTSVFLTQPIQVLVVAALLSLIFKDPSLADDDGEEDEEELELADDEAYLHQMPQEGYARPRKIAYKPPDPAVLEKARLQRLSEKQMYAVMREIIFYFIFLWMLLVISYSFRDPNAFLIKESFVRNFIERKIAEPDINFRKMKTMNQFFDWAEKVMVPQLRADKWYNGQWLPGQRGFIHDRNNRIMGWATIRQLRVKKGKCNLVKPMDKVLRECNVHYNFFNEDTDTKGIGWTELSSNDTWNNTDTEYVHRSAKELDSFPYWAVHHVYAGGGYVRELRGSSRKLQKHIEALKEGGWFDHYTRAVLVEFTVYNAQVNIFTICTIAVEFLPTGSLFPSYRFEPVNLLGYSMDTAGFEILCQIVYMIYILVFMISEARELYKKGKAYFASWWNWVEMMIIFLSLAAAVIFFYRLIQANKLTNQFKETNGNSYMKFQYVGYWNELLLYMIGWLVFLATIKFLRLLRFNRRMSMLASTLRNCANSLMNFALIFLIVFFSYVQFFYLVFFITINEFSTFLVASETCLQMILGRFNFFEMKGANPTLGPLFFLAYVISVALILINMFVTILNEAFSDVRTDLTKQMNDYEIVDFIVKRLKVWTGMGAVVQSDKSQAQQDEYAIQMATLDAMAAKASEGDKFNPNYKGNNAEDMENFPDKVDRLVRYISNMYFPKKEWLEAIAIKKMEEKRKTHDRGPHDYDRF